jgi:hypothetical protein
VTGATRAAALGLAATLGAAGCAHARHGVPAVITDPTEASRAELRRVVSEALHGALTLESTLVIERARPRDENGLPLVGRDTGRPERFRLVKDGSHCVLVHEGTGERYPLESTTCQAQE